MKTSTIALLTLLSTATATEPQRKRNQIVHQSNQQNQPRKLDGHGDHGGIFDSEAYDPWMGTTGSSLSMITSMSLTNEPTRSPLAEGETRSPTGSPTPYPTRSPLEEGETHAPTEAPTDEPTRSPLAAGETASPTESPVGDEEVPVESGASVVKGVVGSVVMAAGAAMLL